MHVSALSTKPQDQAKITQKETTLFSSNGYINSTFNKGNYDSGITNVSAKTTQKQTLVNNKYKGQVFTDKGLGYTVAKYHAKTTGKEILTNNGKNYTMNGGKIVKNSIVRSTFENPEKVRNAIHTEYTGNAGYNNGNESRAKFKNAIIRDSKEQAIKGTRPSLPGSIGCSGKESQLNTKLTNNMLLKEQADSRPKDPTNFNIIPTKESVGLVLKVKNERNIDRLQPDLIKEQLKDNPFVNSNF